MFILRKNDRIGIGADPCAHGSEGNVRALFPRDLPAAWFLRHWHRSDSSEVEFECELVLALRVDPVEEEREAATV